MVVLERVVRRLEMRWTLGFEKHKECLMSTRLGTRITKAQPYV